MIIKGDNSRMEKNDGYLPRLNQVIWQIKIRDIPSIYRFRGYVNGIWFKDFIEPNVSAGLIESLINEITAYVYNNL